MSVRCCLALSILSCFASLPAVAQTMKKATLDVQACAQVQPEVMERIVLANLDLEVLELFDARGAALVECVGDDAATLRVFVDGTEASSSTIDALPEDASTRSRTLAMALVEEIEAVVLTLPAPVEPDVATVVEEQPVVAQGAEDPVGAVQVEYAPKRRASSVRVSGSLALLDRPMRPEPGGLIEWRLEGPWFIGASAGVLARRSSLELTQPLGSLRLATLGGFVAATFALLKREQWGVSAGAGVAVLRVLASARLDDLEGRNEFGRTAASPLAYLDAHVKLTKHLGAHVRVEGSWLAGGFEFVELGGQSVVEHRGPRVVVSPGVVLFF
ncbi:MAG: hypothetical protein AAGI01_15095 [Myxococcota bacterium]